MESFRYELRQQDTLYADFADTPLTYTTDSIANYKSQYPQQIREKAEEIEMPISRVHTEVAVQDHLTDDDGWRAQIDVVIF